MDIITEASFTTGMMRMNVGGAIPMKRIIRRSYHYIREMDLLRFLEPVRIFLANVHNRLSMICLAVGNWYENSPSYFETINTHNHDAKMLLINKLRNQ